MGEYTWYTFTHLKKKKRKFIATFQFITLRSELIVELLSIENILRDR